MAATTLVDLQTRPLAVELSQPFGIATGAQEVAANVAVMATLEDGTRGLGEAAPFPAVTGHTQADAQSAIERMRGELIGRDTRNWRQLSRDATAAALGVQAAVCAVETAILDALTRSAGLPLWAFFGGAEVHLTTDITVVTGTVETARRAATRAADQGFALLKVKIGGADLGHDIGRLLAIAESAPSARFVLDANASLSDVQAIELLRELGPIRDRVAVFEQPTAKDDLDGLRRVHEVSGISVMADESAQSAPDLARLAEAHAAQGVNIKITKSGICEALDMVSAARSLGLELMIGGMVETKIAMSTSACLAAGLGGFSYADLDTPLFLKAQPTKGGYAQNGPHLALDGITLGHGVELA